MREWRGVPSRGTWAKLCPGITLTVTANSLENFSFRRERIFGRVPRCGLYREDPAPYGEREREKERGKERRIHFHQMMKQGRFTCVCVLKERRGEKRCPTIQPK
jgi:hypothetical protein